MSPLPTFGAALLLALPLTASAQSLRDVRHCVFTSAGAQEVDALYDPATGDSYVLQNGRRVGFHEAYPAGPQHAAAAPWYIHNEPIEVNGSRYTKYGLPRILGVSEVTRIAHYRQALVFAEPGMGERPEVVYVAVRQGCEFQPYMLEMRPDELRDPAPDADAAADDGAVLPIAVGQRLSGALTAADATLRDGSPYRLYQFTAVAGQPYVVTLASEDFDAVLVVAAMDGDEMKEIASNDDGPDMGTDARAMFTAPTSGTFFIRANAFAEGQTGRFTLSLEGPPAATAAATPVRVGATTSGHLATDDATLDDGSHYDLYSFIATAGQRYVVTLTSEDYDTFLAVGTMNGEDFERIDSNDDGPGMGTNSQVTFTAPTSGTLVVRANSLSGGQTGRYTLRIEQR